LGDKKAEVCYFRGIGDIIETGCYFWKLLIFDNWFGNGLIFIYIIRNRLIYNFELNKQFNMDIPRVDIQAEKVSDIIEYTTGKLLHVENAEYITNLAFQHFVEIEPPFEEQFINLITLNADSGVGGGNTIKPGNIFLNWKKLLLDGVEHYLTIAGAIATPYLIPFAALVVWNKVWSLRKIEISENHAIVLSALWDIRNDKNIVDASNRLDLVNTHFAQFTKKQVSLDEYNSIIDDLYKMQILELNRDGTIWLREWVRKSYS
jgi:hypothetical protein